MKKILYSVLCLFLLMSLCACSNKKGISTIDFKDTLKSEGYYVTDITNDVDGNDFKVALLANNKKYQIEYYEFKDEKKAKKAYESNKKMFENYKKKDSKEKEKTKTNYSFYSLKTTDTYYSASRSGKTLIYTQANSEYSKELKKLFNKLNY